MGLFKNIFGKKEETSKVHRGFHVLKVSKKEFLTSDMVQFTFDTAGNEATYKFIPGQYINLDLNINGKEERRSYSICSGKDEPLSVAVKRVENGVVSNYMIDSVEVGQEIAVSEPEGHFLFDSDYKNVMAIAAGSGITPIVSIAKEVEAQKGYCQLFFANKTEADIAFKSTLDGLTRTNTAYYLTREEKDGFAHGRIGKESFTAELKKDLSLLKYDAYYLCGPAEMIKEVEEVLHMFGVSKDKIHHELFTPPTEDADEKEITFTATSHIKVVLDDDVVEFDLDGDGPSILDKANDEGLDAPYSCRGGVCSTCRAKVLKGSAMMKVNYSLTDKEVEEGYVLTCQAHPTSDELVVSYDE